jgi:hypothetical protein
VAFPTPQTDAQSETLRACLDEVLNRVGRHGLSCPLCYRAEVVAQIARENPGWSRLRVELHVDALLAAPAWRTG